MRLAGERRAGIRSRGRGIRRPGPSRGCADDRLRRHEHNAVRRTPRNNKYLTDCREHPQMGSTPPWPEGRSRAILSRPCCCNRTHPFDRSHVSAQNGATSRSDEVPVTSAARRALKRDLASLHAQRREVPARLRIAREFGDTANNRRTPGWPSSYRSRGSHDAAHEDRNRGFMLPTTVN
jgi:hypothetical protein